MAISGNTVVVGARLEDSGATGVNGNQADNSSPDSGAAYVFVRSGGVWSQQAYLKASNAGANDTFGSSVAISGDTVVVGAFGEGSASTGVNGNQADNSASRGGAAYVFVRSGSVWSQQAYLKASNTGATDLFGASVAISGDTVVVGAFGEDSAATEVNGNQADNSASSSGAAYVFVRSGGVWSQQAYLKASNTGATHQFGVSVAISGDTVVVGAYGEFLGGAAYVFVRSGGVWSQQAHLKASNAEASDSFGFSVAISGDTVVVGALYEDSAATGVNGNQADNSASLSGAAYVFVRSGGAWSQQAYLKASNTGEADRFGYSVAISGDTVVVGAPYEFSVATGVNGNQADNSASFSGAAYVFVIPQAKPIQIASSPSGLLFNVTGLGCEPGTGYTTPRTLPWETGSSCTVTFSSPQVSGGTNFEFQSWEDSSTNAMRTITAPAAATTYTGTFRPVLNFAIRSVPTFNRTTLRYEQRVAITNPGSDTITGSALALDNLPPTLALYQPDGLTLAAPPAGSPYRNLPAIGPGATVELILQFTRTAPTALTYTPRFIGAGPR